MKIESQQNNVEFLRETAEWTHLVSKSITLENWIKTQQTSWFLVLGAYFISRSLQFLREIALCVQNKGMKFNCFMLISLVFSVFMLHRAHSNVVTAISTRKRGKNGKNERMRLSLTTWNIFFTPRHQSTQKARQTNHMKNEKKLCKGDDSSCFSIILCSEKWKKNFIISSLTRINLCVAALLYDSRLKRRGGRDEEWNNN